VEFFCHFGGHVPLPPSLVEEHDAMTTMTLTLTSRIWTRHFLLTYFQRLSTLGWVPQDTKEQEFLGIADWLFYLIIHFLSSILITLLYQTLVVFLRFYGQDCRKAANCRIKFTHRSKISIFTPAGATLGTNSSEIWRSRWARGSTWPCKISRQSVPWDGNAAPKWQKFPLFGKESPRRGEPFDRFLQLSGALIRPTTLH